jgi:hypothetical protein
MTNASSWTYDYSDALSMRYAYRQTPLGIEVITEDKTRYTAQEVKIMAKAGIEITPGMHSVKRVFQGEIVDVKKM